MAQSANLSAVAPACAVATGGESFDEVIATAPLRIDLTGGFTDVAPFSTSIEALHVNAALDLTVEAACSARNDGQIQISFAADLDASSSTSAGRQRLLAALRLAVAEFAAAGLNLAINSAVPAGSGLGSSGAILVAAVGAAAGLTRIPLTPAELATRAIKAAAQTGIVGGRQDEFAAAHGSLRAYVFEPSGNARIIDLASAGLNQAIEESLLVVQMGANGRRVDVVAEVVAAVRNGDGKTIGALQRLQELAHVLVGVLQRQAFGELPAVLRETRAAQSQLHARLCCPIASAAMASICRRATGVEYKMLGGGGSGSCILVHMPKGQRKLAMALIREHAMRVLPVRIRHSGMTIESRRAARCIEHQYHRIHGQEHVDS